MTISLQCRRGSPTGGHTVRSGLTLFSGAALLTAGQNLKKADQP